MDSRGPIDQALGLAMMLSPTGKEQGAFVLMLQEMRADGCDDESLVEGLLSAMLDGVRHGNWPKPEHSDKADACCKEGT